MDNRSFERPPAGLATLQWVGLVTCHIGRPGQQKKVQNKLERCAILLSGAGYRVRFTELQGENRRSAKLR